MTETHFNILKRPREKFKSFIESSYIFEESFYNTDGPEGDFIENFW